MINQCNFIGRLGRDPEIRYTQSGKAVASFSLACSEKRGGEESTEWVNIVAWEKLAEICGQYLVKGSLVFISGKLQTRKWQDRDGGELFNGFQHETERIPAHRLEELHQLGTALLGECPENDCTIYRNVFRMAVDVDGQMGKLTGHARETMQREYDRLLRELNHLYTMNHAVKKYREAQHDRT